MLKRSYYNIPIKQKGFTIIYNSFSDHFLGVSQEVANRLGSGIFDPENFRIAFPKTFAKLQDLGMLIDDGIDELDLIKKRYEAAKFRDKRLYLMLYPILHKIVISNVGIVMNRISKGPRCLRP